MPILRFYAANAWDEAHVQRMLKQLQQLSVNIIALEVEHCYHVETASDIPQDTREMTLLRWLLKHPQAADSTLRQQSALSTEAIEQGTKLLIEIGPRFNFSTPFSTNCVNICQNVGLQQVKRLEQSQRYLITLQNADKADALAINEQSIVELLSDRMTQCRYTEANLPSQSFNEQLPQTQQDWYYVPLLERGRQALEQVNWELGLAFSDWDLDYYTNMFVQQLQRNPTTVELFDCAQSNSEHSRHWFFRGNMHIDGIQQPKSLIRMIMDTQLHTNDNNTIKFSDNSSAIKGYELDVIRSTNAEGPAAVVIAPMQMDLIFTAETHNMPTAVAPFSGATTGTGGRIRDVQGVGRGGLPIAGTAGYSVGCLNIPDYPQPYENAAYKYPNSFAKPLKVLIEASNGASDYGNKFGEPVIAGFVNSYGLNNAMGERVEYVKPIMFSAGLGIMDANMREKIAPEQGFLLAKIGGPVYRIGVGGGAASSVEVQGSNDAQLDFNAVQRGDAEMENKLNRVVRACIEMGDKNPILAIHDQGAGGNGNVLKELVEPNFAGAIIFTKEFQLGDPTINALELWGAEYQENNAILCHFKDRDLLEKICARERCPISFVGVVSNNGRVTLIEAVADFERALTTDQHSLAELGAIPFDLELKHVLGEMPKRDFYLQRIDTKLLPLKLADATVSNYAQTVKQLLSLLAVGSKRFLTNKVDRCVGGLIAQQQCVGPLHTPLADFGLVAVSHFAQQGIATSIGTQPIKGLLSPAAMARMCIAEALSNLVFCKISELADVKCSGNWMWAAKLAGEGAKLFEACKEMCEMMQELRIAVDGGKDSLSMAAKVADDTIKSPGTLVISTYVPCPDINVKITPDLKGPAMGVKTALVWINIEGKFRLGASALAQIYAQQGDECPTLLRTDLLAHAFNVTQQLLTQGKLLAGHDISDGGLMVCLLEMSIAGLAGIQIGLSAVLEQLNVAQIDRAAAQLNMPELALLYAEECGWVLEVALNELPSVQRAFTHAGVPNYCIGTTAGYGLQASIEFRSKNATLLCSDVQTIYKQWERTSHELEQLQANVDCVKQEYETLNYRTGPKYFCCSNLANLLNTELTFLRTGVAPIQVAVLREEGVNSDREMMASLLQANFEVHDVTMSDLLAGKTNLSRYCGLIFPGGFSYADTLGSAKGWAVNIMFSELLSPQFAAFKQRSDTFSLGVCNGCQLMALIGWIGTESSGGIIEQPDVAVLHNKSERFECRWSSVRIAVSKAMLLKKLQGFVLGCWVAHGEGRFSFRSKEILQQLKAAECVALQYVNDNGDPTEVYPMNPNGSIDGIAALCSADGRHLAIMPHPERCTAMYQWPYVSPGFDVHGKLSPWQIMFNSAYEWCLEQQQQKH